MVLPSGTQEIYLPGKYADLCNSDTTLMEPNILWLDLRPTPKKGSLACVLQTWLKIHGEGDWRLK